MSAGKTCPKHFPHFLQQQVQQDISEKGLYFQIVGLIHDFNKSSMAGFENGGL